MEEKQINTRTLGGWLILIQIFIILNAISWVGNLQMFYGIYGEKDTLIKAQNIQDPGLYNAFIYYELAMSLLLTFGAFLVFYYFFKRNKNFPLIMTVYLIIEVAAEGLSFLLFGSMIPDKALIYQKFGFTFVIAVAIIIYLKVSKRVKLTFIH
jgi:hypothetical protein